VELWSTWGEVGGVAFGALFQSAWQILAKGIKVGKFVIGDRKPDMSSKREYGEVRSKLRQASDYAVESVRKTGRDATEFLYDSMRSVKAGSETLDSLHRALEPGYRQGSEGELARQALWFLVMEGFYAWVWHALLKNVAMIHVNNIAEPGLSYGVEDQNMFNRGFGFYEDIPLDNMTSHLKDEDWASINRTTDELMWLVRSNNTLKDASSALAGSSWPQLRPVRKNELGEGLWAAKETRRKKPFKYRRPRKGTKKWEELHARPAVHSAKINDKMVQLSSVSRNISAPAKNLLEVERFPELCSLNEWYWCSELDHIKAYNIMDPQPKHYDYHDVTVQCPQEHPFQHIQGNQMADVDLHGCTRDGGLLLQEDAKRTPMMWWGCCDYQHYWYQQCGMNKWRGNSIAYWCWHWRSIEYDQQTCVDNRTRIALSKNLIEAPENTRRWEENQMDTCRCSNRQYWPEVKRCRWETNPSEVCLCHYEKNNDLSTNTWYKTLKSRCISKYEPEKIFMPGECLKIKKTATKFPSIFWGQWGVVAQLEYTLWYVPREGLQQRSIRTNDLRSTTDTWRYGAGELLGTHEGWVNSGHYPVHMQWGKTGLYVILHPAFDEVEEC